MVENEDLMEYLNTAEDVYRGDCLLKTPEGMKRVCFDDADYLAVEGALKGDKVCCVKKEDANKLRWKI